MRDRDRTAVQAHQRSTGRAPPRGRASPIGSTRQSLGATGLWQAAPMQDDVLLALIEADRRGLVRTPVRALDGIALCGFPLGARAAFEAA